MPVCKQFLSYHMHLPRSRTAVLRQIVRSEGINQLDLVVGNCRGLPSQIKTYGTAVNRIHRTFLSSSVSPGIGPACIIYKMGKGAILQKCLSVKFSFVLPPRIELGSVAPQAAILSIKLREESLHSIQADVSTQGSEVGSPTAPRVGVERSRRQSRLPDLASGREQCRKCSTFSSCSLDSEKFQDFMRDRLFHRHLLYSFLQICAHERRVSIFNRNY